jgi:hypothetical protein
MKKTSRAGPLGGAAVCPAAATTKDQEDVYGGPLGGCYRWVRQQPPPKMKKMSMVGPCGVLPVGLVAATTEVQEDIDGGTWPLGGSRPHRLP